MLPKQSRVQLRSRTSFRHEMCRSLQYLCVLVCAELMREETRERVAKGRKAVRTRPWLEFAKSAPKANLLSHCQQTFALNGYDKHGFQLRSPLQGAFCPRQHAAARRSFSLQLLCSA